MKKLKKLATKAHSHKGANVRWTFEPDCVKARNLCET